MAESDEEQDMARKRRKGGKQTGAKRAGAASEARSARSAERSARERAERVEDAEERDGEDGGSTTASTEPPPPKREAPRDTVRALLHAFAWVGVVILLGLGGIVLLSVLPQLE
jgi:hypothetical protein